MEYTQAQLNFIGLAAMFLALTILFTILRFLSRRMRRQAFSWEDWLALGALVCYVAEVAIHLWSMKSGGVGRHITDVSMNQVVVSFKSLTAVEYPYTLAITLIRCSIAILLLRIFSAANWLRWSLYFCIFLNVAWLIFIFIDAATICQPFAMNWDTSIPGGHCADKTTHFIVMGIWGVINDVLLWVLPQAVVWRLNMHISQKIVLSVVFALGLFDVVVGIIRIVALSHLEPPPGDWTYSLAPVEIWSFVEAGVVIIIANVPLCKPVAEALIPRRLATSFRERLGGSSAKLYGNDAAGGKRGAYGPSKALNANPTLSSWGAAKSKNQPMEDDELELFPQGKFGRGWGSSGSPEHYNVEVGGHEEEEDSDIKALKNGNSQSTTRSGIRVTHDISVTEERR